MIAKVRTGRSFIKLNQYNYREGEFEKHRDPHRIGGNVIGDDPWTLTDEFRSFAAANPRVESPVWHASLRVLETERLTDDQWDQASKRFLQEMGFLRRGSDGFQSGDAPYVALRHAENHIHIVACRVRFDGSCVNVYRDRLRSHEAARAVEAELGLSSPKPSRDPLASVTKSERESALRRKEVPERARLREAVSSARDSSDGTVSSFESNLAGAGIQFKANVATTGRMNGYSFSLPGWTDANGEQVWIAGSKVSRQLRWKQLSQDLEATRLAQINQVGGRRKEPGVTEFDNAAARWWRHKVERQADIQQAARAQHHWAAFNQELNNRESQADELRRRLPLTDRQGEETSNRGMHPSRSLAPQTLEGFERLGSEATGEGNDRPGTPPPRGVPAELDLPYEPEPQSEVGRVLSEKVALGASEREQSVGRERDR